MNDSVIYARYSSDNQREESIEGQLRECKAFADKNAIQQGIVTPSTKQRLEDLEKQKSDISVQIIKEEMSKAVAYKRSNSLLVPPFT